MWKCKSKLGACLAVIFLLNLMFSLNGAQHQARASGWTVLFARSIRWPIIEPRWSHMICDVLVLAESQLEELAPRGSSQLLCSVCCRHEPRECRS